MDDFTISTVKFLLDNGADVNSKDFENYTLLHRAVMMGNYSLIKFLLENNASTKIKNKSNKTAFDLACHYGYFPGKDYAAIRELLDSFSKNEQ